MAKHDVKADALPALQYPPRGLHPTVSELRTALTTYSATSYSASRLETMTKDDMIYACRLHGLTVTGL